MPSRRQFLEQALIGCSVVGFTGRTRAVALYLYALFTGRPSLLPEGWTFYECAGQILFPIYGASGSLTTTNVCYLIQKAGKQYYAIAVPFNDLEMMATDDKGVERLCAFKLKEAIKNIKPVPVDMNGGALPLPEGFNA